MSEKYLVYSHRVTALPLLRSRETCDTSDRLKGSTTEGVKMAVRNEKNDRVQRAVWSQLVATAGCRHALTVTELSGALLHRAPFLPKTFFLAFFPFPAFIFPLRQRSFLVLRRSCEYERVLTGKGVNCSGNYAAVVSRLYSQSCYG